MLNMVEGYISVTSLLVLNCQEKSGHTKFYGVSPWVVLCTRKTFLSLPKKLASALTFGHCQFHYVQNKDLENVIGDCCFVSVIFRLFKFPKTGPTKRCQVIYNGGIMGHEKDSIFDTNLTFKKDETVEVDEETAAILKNSQFAQDFLIRPTGEKLPTCGGCTALAAKDTITDPSKVAQESDNTKSRSPLLLLVAVTKKCCENNSCPEDSGQEMAE